MSRWRLDVPRRRRRLLAGVDATQLALASPGHPGAVVHAGRDALAHLPGPTAGAADIDLVAASDIARHWVQVPPSSVASFAELRQVAALRCAHLHGGGPEDWWVTADWSARHPFVCAALPSAVVAAVQDGIARAGLRAHWHTAWSLVGRHCARALPDQGWAALRTPQRLALWHCNAGRVTSFAALAIEPHASDTQAVKRAFGHIQAAALREGLPSAGGLAWIHLDGFAAPASLPGTTAISLSLGPAPEEAPRSEATAAWLLGGLLAKAGA